MKTADDWIDELSKGTTQAFPNIARSEVLSGLRDRIAHPEHISQRTSSLCGPAALMYAMASRKPDYYARYVVELFHDGRSKIGSLNVKPGDGCKGYKATAGSGDIHPVDWIALASLRDSENDWFKYDSPNVEAGGITMPEDLADWFKAVGFKRDSNVTNVFFTKDLKDLTDASTKFNNQQVVCLFISVNLLSHPDEASNIPSHWVVMTSPATISTPEAPRPSFGLQGMPPVPGPQAKSGKPIVSVQVFTWGGLRTIRMETDKFCSNFYGYVSSSV